VVLAAAEAEQQVVDLKRMQQLQKPSSTMSTSKDV
jgi:hypothetical protein